MWLATQQGFYSVIRGGEDSFHVRARVRRDLVNLCALADLDYEVLEWPDADYRYRMVITLEDLLEIMVRLATDVDYASFTNRIASSDSQCNKLGAYHKVWDTLSALQIVT